MVSVVPRRPTIPSGQKESLEKIFDGLQLRIRRVDGSIPYKAVASLNAVQKAVRLCDQQLFQSAVEQLLDRLDDDDFDRVYAALLAHYLPSEVKDKKKDVRHQREVDTSYLDQLVPVGAYNPDEAWPRGTANKRADAVRCECGSLEEDGKMLQCDACNFWLHTDCVGNIDENTVGLFFSVPVIPYFRSIISVDCVVGRSPRGFPPQMFSWRSSPTCD